MLTFLSRSIHRLLHLEAAPKLRALPGSGSDFQRLRSPARGDLRVAGDRDIAVAPVGATAFVAGQGARIYSLSAFRPRTPPNPRAA